MQNQENNKIENQENKNEQNQVFNPYLPSYEYVPDGEPHVFGKRVYVYGSHDRFNAPIFCLNDYVCWSASVDDLSEWCYEGVIYRKNQDPLNKNGHRCLYAPDVAKGPDGRYYLYYALDFMGVMSVAVSDTPAGEYQFLGHVHFQDGHIWGTKSGEPFPFDPGVLVDDDGRVYLYSGFAIKVPSMVTKFHNLTNPGAVVLELDSDMVTIRNGPELLFPRKGKQGAFFNHAFFEASSIRKYGDIYYFIYSSEHNHELCYATSNGPKGPFTFGGTLVSIGDIFINGITDEKQALNYLGNTHGSIIEVKGQWYVFYHRQTNRHSYSRQACAELLERKIDGGFKQAEITSCGLNGGALKGTGRYEARIACNLRSKKGVGRYDAHFAKLLYYDHPYFTQDGEDREDNPNQYIANMRDGAVAGFKYFDIKHLEKIAIEVRGKCKGKMAISTTPDFLNVICKIPVSLNGYGAKRCENKCKVSEGKQGLYFKFTGKGTLDFIAFELVD